jgi:hypothetical protein
MDGWTQTTDCCICDAKMKYNGKAYCNISHGYLWRWEIKKKPLIVFSHVEQQTKS